MKELKQRLLSLAEKLKLKYGNHSNTSDQENSKRTSKKLAPKGFVPVHIDVGDGKYRCYNVPVQYLRSSNIMLVALLHQFEEEIDVSRGPITLSCDPAMFESVLQLCKAEKDEEKTGQQGSPLFS
ncbi:hypothetical protein Tsubulata_041121 [Turnera subulata]|uniref:Uncharacterized protein n=1 Tax=Turnera subulata TaxID=218843 RepID=A0A9Q0FGY4_9ROSI|nr:hypothetical protein Tsubulata_041121 [Turnera subulata]